MLTPVRLPEGGCCPPRHAKPLTRSRRISCWPGGLGERSATRNKAPLLSAESGRAAWVRPGRPGGGGGCRDGPCAAGPSSARQPDARPVSLGTQVGPGASGIWVQLLLRHRTPSPCWNNWAVILGGSSRKGCLEHPCQVWLPGGYCHLHNQPGSTGQFVGLASLSQQGGQHWSPSPWDSAHSRGCPRSQTQ